MALSTFDSPTPTAADANGSTERRRLLQDFGLLNLEDPEAPELPPPSPSSLPPGRTLIHRRLQALVTASEGTQAELCDLVEAVSGAATSIPALSQLAERVERLEKSLQVGLQRLEGQVGRPPLAPEPVVAPIPDALGNVRTPLSDAQLTCLRALHSVEQLLLEADSASATTDISKRKPKTKGTFDELRASKLGRDAREVLANLGQADAWEAITEELGDSTIIEAERSLRLVLCQKLRVSVLREGPAR